MTPPPPTPGGRLGTTAGRPHIEQLSESKFFIPSGLFPRAAGVLSLEPMFSSKQTHVNLLVFRATGAFSAQTKAMCGAGWPKPRGARTWEAESVGARAPRSSPVPVIG